MESLEKFLLTIGLSIFVIFGLLSGTTTDKDKIFFYIDIAFIGLFIFYIGLILIIIM